MQSAELRKQSHALAIIQAHSTSTNYHTQTRKEHNMKLEIDWLEMAKAVAKAIWPFIAGAFGGLFSGYTFGGIGSNFI